MMRILRLLAVNVKRQFLEWMAWRGFLFTLVVNQAVTPLIGLAIWSVALPGNTQIASYYVVLLAVQLMTVSYEHHTIANGIYAGALSQELLKPQPVVLGPLGTNIALRLLHLICGIPLILLAAVLAHISLDFRLILLALPALALAAMLRFLFTYMLALSAFWSEQAHGTVGFGELLIFLLGGSAAPLQFFPAPLRVLGDALPFNSMLGFPAQIAVGSISSWQILQGYGWQLFWILIAGMGVVLTWRSGVRRYTAVGG